MVFVYLVIKVILRIDGDNFSIRLVHLLDLQVAPVDESGVLALLQTKNKDYDTRGFRRKREGGGDSPIKVSPRYSRVPDRGSGRGRLLHIIRSSSIYCSGTYPRITRVLNSLKILLFQYTKGKIR